MLTGISTLSIGDVNPLTQAYVEPPGFAWADLYQDIPQSLLITSDIYPPPLVQSWYWSLMNMVLFLVLAWYVPQSIWVDVRYLDSVLPDEFGVRQKPLFFLHKSYWGFTKKAKDAQPRDLNAWLSNVSAHHRQKSTPKPPTLSFLTLFRRNKSPSPNLSKTSRFARRFHRNHKLKSENETSTSDLSASSSLDPPEKPHAD